MSSSFLANLRERVLEADTLYHRLVLIVGPPKSGKTTALQTLSEALHVPVLNLNLMLSQSLLDLPYRTRILDAPRLFAAAVLSCPRGPAILDNLEILFDARLKLDPVACLRQASRNRVIVASFPGTVSDEHLVYAEPGHPEYRRFPTSGILTVLIDQTEFT
jgi:hypothetical protein